MQPGLSLTVVRNLGCWGQGYLNMSSMLCEAVTLTTPLISTVITGSPVVTLDIREELVWGWWKMNEHSFCCVAFAETLTFDIMSDVAVGKAWWTDLPDCGGQAEGKKVHVACQGVQLHRPHGLPYRAEVERVLGVYAKWCNGV